MAKLAQPRTGKRQTPVRTTLTMGLDPAIRVWLVRVPMVVKCRLRVATAQDRSPPTPVNRANQVLVVASPMTIV
jgi:nicotinamide mononucleotide adenylyltransferase